MPPELHSYASVSASSRWLNCPLSLKLSQEFEDKTTEAAAEGTAAHALSEYKVKKLIYGVKEEKPVSEYDSQEMEEYTDDYTQYIAEIIAGKKVSVFIEQWLDLSEYIPGGFGTADCIIADESVLHVVDFKYGIGVLVDAYENPQLKIYGLGALKLLEDLYDFKTVRLHIFQPRKNNVSEFELSVDSLMDWAENELKPKAFDAVNGNGVCNPGEWCRFCKASVKCRACAEQGLCVEKYGEKNPELLTDAEIAEVLLKVQNLVSWTDKVMEYALNEAVMHGKKWTGFKLVEGRSVRRYSDETKVAEAAKSAGFSSIYKETLISVTEMQKMMGTKRFNEVIGPLIEKPHGRPTLVPETDKRPEIKAINFDSVKGE